ncbi:MAG: DUF1016 family protein [Candidatus Omnitrophica bacterium]|nr:DUF1016 family protein [Candidatus Omnitrophota bacterium]
MPKIILKSRSYSGLVNELSSLIEQGRRVAVRQVNVALVVTYWSIGRSIVQHEQGGALRAEYGDEVLLKLAQDLTKRFGKGFSSENLRLMRRFFMLYRRSVISQTASGKFGVEKPQTLSGALGLSWSHYCLLMRIDEEHKRTFYEVECARGNWSVRQLNRQLQSMLYERTALSKKKAAVISKAHKAPIVLKPEDEVKDPYVLEFLGLRDEYSESDLEDGLIRHLEHFLLEMGAGFTFVARQKRITLEGAHYRLDLLLYHRVLRCLVGIDLKLGEFTHADAGQMNLYLNYLKAKEMLPGENPPVGIVLCADKRKTVAEYALGGLDNKIFASKYRLQLPNEKVLMAQIEQEQKRFFEAQG